MSNLLDHHRLNSVTSDPLDAPLRIFPEFAKINFQKKDGENCEENIRNAAARSGFNRNRQSERQCANDEKRFQNPMVGGAPMLRTMDIIDNAVNSADHTTLVAAVKAAGLVDTLKSKGPFTVFAPTNAAFDKLPAGTVGTLVKPENKDTLTKILTYHVIAGKFDSKAIAKKIKAGGGTAQFTTVSGDRLTARMNGN